MPALPRAHLSHPRPFGRTLRVRLIPLRALGGFVAANQPFSKPHHHPESQKKLRESRRRLVGGLDDCAAVTPQGAMARGARLSQLGTSQNSTAPPLMLLPGFISSRLIACNTSIENTPKISQKVIGNFHPISAKC